MEDQLTKNVLIDSLGLDGVTSRHNSFSREQICQFMYVGFESRHPRGLFFEQTGKTGVDGHHCQCTDYLLGAWQLRSRSQMDLQEASK